MLKNIKYFTDLLVKINLYLNILIYNETYYLNLHYNIIDIYILFSKFVKKI